MKKSFLKTYMSKVSVEELEDNLDKLEEDLNYLSIESEEINQDLHNLEADNDLIDSIVEIDSFDNGTNKLNNVVLECYKNICNRYQISLEQGESLNNRIFGSTYKLLEKRKELNLKKRETLEKTLNTTNELVDSYLESISKLKDAEITSSEIIASLGSVDILHMFQKSKKFDSANITKDLMVFDDFYKYTEHKVKATVENTINYIITTRNASKKLELDPITKPSVDLLYNLPNCKQNKVTEGEYGYMAELELNIFNYNIYVHYDKKNCYLDSDGLIELFNEKNFEFNNILEIRNIKEILNNIKICLKAIEQHTDSNKINSFITSIENKTDSYSKNTERSIEKTGMLLKTTNILASTAGGAALGTVAGGLPAKFNKETKTGKGAILGGVLGLGKGIYDALTDKDELIKPITNIIKNEINLYLEISAIDLVSFNMEFIKAVLKVIKAYIKLLEMKQ